jgi:capsid protein
VDIKESMEYQLLKIKVHALFGYAITSDLLDDSTGDGLPTTSNMAYDQDPEDDVNPGVQEVEREVDFSNGPVGLDLSPGEKVQLIESQTPPESVKAFTELAIRVSLLSLDIPYTFFDARQSTFAQVIADRKMYEISVKAKADKNREVMEEYLDWKLRQWTENGDIPADYLDIRDAVHVKSIPTPWIDKVNEISAEERAVAIGIKSIPQLCRERGVDADEVLKQQSEYLRKARELNVPIFIGDPGARSERDNEIDNEIRVEEHKESIGEPDEPNDEI